MSFGLGRSSMRESRNSQAAPRSGSSVLRSTCVSRDRPTGALHRHGQSHSPQASRGRLLGSSGNRQWEGRGMAPLLAPPPGLLRCRGRRLPSRGLGAAAGVIDGASLVKLLTPEALELMEKPLAHRDVAHALTLIARQLPPRDDQPKLNVELGRCLDQRVPLAAAEQLGASNE